MRFFRLYFLIFTISSYASIGHISALRGNIYIERDGVESRIFKGFQVENKDIIKTSRRGKVQIIFKDRTVIRIGKSSKFEILDYLFDNTKKSKANFRVSHGFFNVITGKIGKISNNMFKLHTKSSTIGIRGTHFQGLIKDGIEDIACLRGSIFIEVKDKIIDVMAGNILNIRLGIPSNPKALKTVDIVRMEKDALEKIDTPAIASVKYEAYISKYISKKTKLLQSQDGKVNLSVFTFQTPLDNSYKNIEKAEPFDVSISAEKETLSNIPKNSWNGDSTGGKIFKYSGNIIFIDNILNKITKKKIELNLDTQNSFATGNFEYFDKNIRFSNSGKGAVTQDNFLLYSNNVLTGTNVDRLIFPEQGGYFAGENAYAKVGIVKSDFFDVPLSEKMKDKILNGGFIVTKTNEFDIYQKNIGKDNIFSWGYWAYKDNKIEKLRGGWVKTDLDFTSKNKINEFVKKSVRATYSGNIFGTVENYITKDEIQKIENGKFNIDFDFMANRTEGDMKFSTDKKDFKLDFVANDILKENGEISFKVRNFEFKNSSTVKPEYIYGNGRFIGENAENVIGGFTAGFKNGDTAITSFKGSKEKK